ncbi:MAG: thiamine biosynthesis protein ThiJ [Maricaulis sp.]|nr:thiamine biosynthesis protein ThiJ [Oceanicaulis sp.]MAZ90385.1 thiamine biosynthesis protein ThiJ [Maricaulis sp.]
MTATLNIGFLLFDDITQLDFTGPLQVLSRVPGAKVHLVARTLDPVRTVCGPFILPDTTIAACPDLDLICIPGGFGVDAAMQDDEIVDFVRRQGAQARYVTSVCTGAFILGAAGLLAGRQATTHWRYHALLAAFGAEPVKARVVRDGNLFTGGGVTAGIDFAFTVVVELAGETVAQAIQLGLEYDPHPPVDCGSPDKACVHVRGAVEQRFAPRVEAFEGLLREMRAAETV